MIVQTVALCPDLTEPDGYDRDALAVALAAVGMAAVAPVVPSAEPADDERTRRAHWVAHLAVGLGAAQVRAPLLPVLPGRAGALAPAFGLSQRAARRSVAGYVLLDADCPASDSIVDNWPDAPIVYLASPAAPGPALAQARLRGWALVPVPDLDPNTLAAVLAALRT